MRIAVVGPSPVPFVIGGMEKHFFSLVSAINRYTAHSAELIKVPVREDNFWNLVESYQNFYNLDLDHFDMIITIKYPAWMVKHRNHTVWMNHKLRGLYDTYPSSEPTDIDKKDLEGCELAEEILKITESEPSDSNLSHLFDLLHELKDKSKTNQKWKHIFRFPGPFIRKIVHFMDDVALSPKKIISFSSVSNNIQLRRDYFPKGVAVKTIYVPPSIENAKEGVYDYLLTVNRLDGPKRVDLLIEAMKYVPYETKLKIVGEGPLYQQLVEKSKEDKRIEFIGFVGQEALEDLYSNALVVLYTPHDEDLGLVPLEAFSFKKPVITLTDSGGPTELVDNAFNGFVVEPNPQKIAEKINLLIENKDLARSMGEAGYFSAVKLNWKEAALELLGEKKASSKTKMLVLSTYSSYPTIQGGQLRLYNLCKNLAEDFNVTILSLVELDKPRLFKILENGLRQICIPESKQQAEKRLELERKTQLSLHDICAIDYVFLSKEFIDKAKELVEDSSTILFAHPYLFGLSSLIDKNKVRIYDSHNVEYTLKRDAIKDSKEGNILLKKVFDIEKKACLESDLIFCTCETDKEQLMKLYNPKEERIVIVPNGVDTNKVKFIDRNEKLKQKNNYGLDNRNIILFVGSWHPPNLEALNFIMKIARKFPNSYFFVVGSVKDYYSQMHPISKVPKNVLLFGTLEEEEKMELYRLADIAINPMLSGSGTNIKMLDFMAAGIPVVSTKIGSRGFNIRNGEEAIICEVGSFDESMKKLLGNPRLQEKLRLKGRVKAEEFNWTKISKKAKQSITKLLGE